MRAIIKSLDEEYEDMMKRVVSYTRKTGSPGHWSYEYDNPHEKKMVHEFHRLTTMDEGALKRRATKITHADKMADFYGLARASGKPELAEHIRNEGINRLRMSPAMFKSRRHVVMKDEN